MKIVDILRRVVGNSDSSAQSLMRADNKLDALVAGCANQTDLLNGKFEQVIAGLNNQSALLNRKFDRLIEGVFRGREAGNGEMQVLDAMQAPPATLREAMERLPLLIAERTYNTSHPDYDARVVRNFPGRVFNLAKPCENAALEELGRLVQGDQVPDQA